jgi:DNA (cytosine-5)-methyltransferase 1
MKKQVTMVDLFCGAGIGAIGFKEAGYKIIWAVDNNKHAINTYNKNIGNHAILSDIKKIDMDDIPYADVITAGFPCQPFSLSGKGEGVNCEKKGDLGEYFLRIVENKKPKAFMFENVAGIATKKHKEFFNNLIKMFEDIGYNVSWQLINCWDYSLPQARKRVFAIGIRNDLNKEFIFPQKLPDKDKRCIRDAIGDLPEPYNYPETKDILKNHYGLGIRNDEKPFVDKISIGGNWRDLDIEEQKKFLGGAFNSGGGRTGFLRKINFDKPAHTITSLMDGKNNAQILDNRDKYRNHYFKEDGYSKNYLSRNRQRQWDEPSFTIVSSCRHLPLFPEPNNYDIREMDKYDVPPPRRFTVRECLRLQSVPDSFYFDDDVPIRKQYERCSGIPSIIAYKFSKIIKDLIDE